MNARDAIKQATALLDDAGCDNPRLDAEILLQHAWGIDRSKLIIWLPETVPDDIAIRFWRLVSRRQQREPIAYITGTKEFWSRSFAVDEHVLIPRPETEHLIEAVLKNYPNRQAAYRFCDIGTGSGCVACTLACEYPNARIVATDISRDALQMAAYNGQKLGVCEHIRFLQGDMFAALDGISKRFDAIISNPPYVSCEEMQHLEPELGFEPRPALTDEQDGLAYLTVLFDACQPWLKHGGHLLLETGPCGFPPLPRYLQHTGIITDLAGLQRGGVFELTGEL